MLYNSCKDQSLPSPFLKGQLAEDVRRCAWCSCLTGVKTGRLRPGLKPRKGGSSHSAATHTLHAMFASGTYPLQGGGSPNALSEGKEVCRDMHGTARFLLFLNFFYLKFVERTNAMSKKAIKKSNLGNAWVGCPPWHFYQSALDFRAEFPGQGKSWGAGRRRLSSPLAPTHWIRM